MESSLPSNVVAQLTRQMSFLKLRMQANKAMKDVAHAAEKEAKAAAKLADKQAREAAKKAAKQAKEAARKAAKEAKAAADKAKKEAAAIAREDERYNEWLFHKETPTAIYNKLWLLKLGKDAKKSPNFDYFTNTPRFTRRAIHKRLMMCRPF
ncbi:unnamed protein product [Phytophthora lilii]|uniref:Unnamed protein product n=1 Tax=Phytophthora lilii TaxID=2077276 RepID=A0A9W7DDE0_9STRA|nr:unnamed protein product [Phytophthora lilii]